VQIQQRDATYRAKASSAQAARFSDRKRDARWVSGVLTVGHQRFRDFQILADRRY
jgi:uncharacterized protein YhjY with autotransporter beta-barrel domain